jgi:putative membrane protein
VSEYCRACGRPLVGNIRSRAEKTGTGQCRRKIRARAAKFINEERMRIDRKKSVAFAIAACTVAMFFGHPVSVQADSDADRDFVRDATTEVIGDAAINRIARDKGEHEEVRHYADERVTMDEKLETELRDIADRHHIGVPGKDELAQAAKDRLERIRKSEHFDREYLGGEVKDSAVIAKLFKEAGDADSDEKLRVWFADKAHTLKDRHEEVKTLNDQFNK